jgi:endonuclease/exonuclease/phosphatase (EEP) superfamily protein YafD
MTQPVSVADDQLSARSQKIRRMSVVGSVLLLVVVSLCFVIQPDWLAPVILVPAWCWLISGLMLACFGFCRGNKRWSIAVLALWAVFTWQFVEEARSLSRFRNLSPVEWQTVRERGHGIRIVSLNCNVGKTRCVEDVAAWEPDVVLLQESPGHEQLQKLTELLFGSDGTFLYRGDVSILVRGKLTPQLSDLGSHFVHAEVELPTAAVLDVVSVRLSPPVPRFDFWLPGFWRDHREKRIEHRQQVREIIDHLKSVPTKRHMIVGGDFNAPPHDDALAFLRSRLSDAFEEAGNGWGATGTNEHPLFRVDQIWVSKSLQAASVTAQKTLYSDHRLVVCDLVVAD